MRVFVCDAPFPDKAVVCACVCAEGLGLCVQDIEAGLKRALERHLADNGGFSNVFSDKADAGQV